MTGDDILAAADQKRARAKLNLQRAFKIPEGFSSLALDRIVDDIIDAAVLEVTAARAKAMHDLMIEQPGASEAAGKETEREASIRETAAQAKSMRDLMIDGTTTRE